MTKKSHELKLKVRHVKDTFHLVLSECGQNEGL